VVVQVEGLGMNTLSLVQQAIALKNSDESAYDQTWCVFDKDDFSDRIFNAAIALAKRNDIKVAYSNQSFELWYVLHFSYLHNAITRKDYINILDEKLGHEYKKNSKDIYKDLKKLQLTAIRNAKRLLREYKPINPAKNDPSTTVHELVEQLIEYSKPFGIS
jgi:hypothetical protein